MSHDDDAEEDVLASVRLHAWRVPAPSIVNRAAILARVLSPAPVRPRVTWMLAAVAIASVAIAAIVVIVILQRPLQTNMTLHPAGGADAQTQERLRRLEQTQQELERKFADVQELRTLVDQLSEKVRQFEQAERAAKAEPKPRRAAPVASDLAPCDEASCAKLQPPAQVPTPSPNPSPTTTSSRALPDTLDRDAVSAGVRSVRLQVEACGQRPTAKGNVKVRVRVSPAGRVTNVLVESTPDAALGACVASAVQKAIFEPTHHGGAFSYPFVFGASP